MTRCPERAPLEPQPLVFRLIEGIYAAALRPEAWQDFVCDLSAAYDGAAVLLTTFACGDSPRYYGTGLVEEFHETHLGFFVNGFAWSSQAATSFVGSFGDGAEVFSGVDLCKTCFFKRWMKPQKLAPVWPIGVTLTNRQGLPLGGLSVFRRDPGEPFSPEDLGLGDRLVPHLERALGIWAQLTEAEYARRALTAVLDRLPTGVILLDSRRRPVVRNERADEIATLNDGFRLWPAGPWVASPRENARLQQLVADSLEGLEPDAGFMAVTRPSGKAPFPVMVAPLLPDPEERRGSRAAAVLFVSNPEAEPIATEGLERLYSLTHAEAELVRHLSQGMSLDEAAAARGISINTARSHLRHVFLKTQTRCQSALLRLVLSGVAPLADGSHRVPDACRGGSSRASGAGD